MQPRPPDHTPQRGDTVARPAVEYILAGNGPGELQGWIAPVARAARALVPDEASRITVTLALTPTQFAGGREREVVERWRLFDRILDPARTVRIALGLERYAAERPAVLVHLGGDLLLSARLARRLRVPACAFAETMLVARRHRHFLRIFAATDELAGNLARQGVPSARLVVTGDPRGDVAPAVAGARQTVAAAPGLVLSFFPGSRDRFFSVSAPYFLETAQAVAARRPGIKTQFILSEFLTPSLVSDVMAARAGMKGTEVTWVAEEGWTAAARSDFAVTIPGTNTLELAMAAVPFAVVVPTQHLAIMPVEGMLEWLARLPGLGLWLRRAGLAAYLRRERYVAFPNKRAGRSIVPEWIGPLTPGDVAARIGRLLDDERTREAMRADLRTLVLARPGASRHIAAEALRVAAEAASH